MLLKDTTDIKRSIETVKELAADWKENADIVSKAFRENTSMVSSIDSLSKGKSKNNLIKMGLTLIAFPFPIVVDDILGWSLLAAGLIQKRIKSSALYIEDVKVNFLDVMKHLGEIKQETLDS